MTIATVRPDRGLRVMWPSVVAAVIMASNIAASSAGDLLGAPLDPAEVDRLLAELQTARDGILPLAARLEVRVESHTAGPPSEGGHSRSVLGPFRGEVRLARDAAVFELRGHAEQPEQVSSISRIGERLAVRAINEQSVQFRHGLELPYWMADIGLIDPTGGCLVSGCATPLDQVLAAAVALSRDALDRGWLWRATIVPGAGGHSEIEFHFEREPTRLRSVRQMIFREGEAQPVNSLVSTVIEWQRVGESVVPARVETVIDRPLPDGGRLTFTRTTLLHDPTATSEDAVAEAAREHARLRDGETAIDARLGLVFSGGSRRFSIDGRRFLAPQPIWEDPGPGITELIAQSEPETRSP